MMRLTVVFSIMCATSIVAQQWKIPVFITDRAEEPQLFRLTVGFHPEATDDNDGRVIGDTLAPPPAPTGNFDARIINAVSEKEFISDIRTSSTEEVAFNIKYQAAEGKGPIVLSWDSVKLAKLGAFKIVDNITGALYGPLDMSTTSSLDVSTGNGLLDVGLRILVTANVVGIGDETLTMPKEKEFILYPNYPNPFNGGTLITFYLGQASLVDLSVFNITGQEIAMLKSGMLNAGLHSVRWNGIHADGNPAPSGIYFARLQGSTEQHYTKMFFIK